MKKKKKTFIDLITSPEIYIEPNCVHFGICNGCIAQNITYEDEVLLKERYVLNLFEEAGIEGFKYIGITPSPSSTAYKNKMEFSFGDKEKGGELSLGLRKKNNYYEVEAVSNCLIIDEDYRKILSATLNFFKNTEEMFYHKIRKEGSLRHLVVRKGKNTGEILVNLVTTDNLKTDLAPYIKTLTDLTLDGEIVGIIRTINLSQADIVAADSQEILMGRSYFYEKIMGLTFKISPFSFFQTNTHGAEKLYDAALNIAGDLSSKTVFDLYSGTGTISIIMAQKAKKVIAVEIVEEAVAAAKENAMLNNVSNCHFICGDVLKQIDEISEKPDLIVLDPPRDGIHPKAIRKIIEIGANEVIYISCKPTSLVRDLEAFINAGYKVSCLSIHDMFARTAHVETVCLLTK